MHYFRVGWQLHSLNTSTPRSLSTQYQLSLDFATVINNIGIMEARELCLVKRSQRGPYITRHARA